MNRRKKTQCIIVIVVSKNFSGRRKILSVHNLKTLPDSKGFKIDITTKTDPDTEKVVAYVMEPTGRGDEVSTKEFPVQGEHIIHLKSEHIIP